MSLQQLKDAWNRNCSIWLCTRATFRECLVRNLFGDKNLYFGKDKTKQGDVCFLLHVGEDALYGPFIAVSDIGYKLEPDAWQGKFPYQIRVSPIGEPQKIDKASVVFEKIGLTLTSLPQSGAKVPQFATYGPEVTRKLLGYFPTVEASMEPVQNIQEGQSEIAYIHKSKAGFEIVAGLNDVKKFIRERMLEPFLAPELAEKYRLPVGGGLLLYGPPGTGKTLIAKATAKEIDADFVEITPSIIRGFPGEPEQHLERLFQRILNLPRVVIFLDDAEALLAKRELVEHSTVMQRIIPVFLSLFSKVHESKSPVLIIAATNKPQSIDEAFLRPGRLEEKLFVGPPDLKARIELLRLKLDERPLSDELKDEEKLRGIAEQLEGWTGADIELLVNDVARSVFREVLKHSSNIKPIALTDIERAIREQRIRPSLSQDQVDELKKWGKNEIETKDDYELSFCRNCPMWNGI